MTTYLALAQRLRSKCRGIGTGPSDITGQSAENQRWLDFTNEAWLYIQRMHNSKWRWMRKSASAVTVNTQPLYSPTADFHLTDFGRWALDYRDGDTFRNYITASGLATEMRMTPIDYDVWRDRYQYGGTRFAFGRPMELAVAPDGSIACGQVPTGGYTLIGDYYSIPTALASTGSVPGLPSQFDWAITYKAMMLYGVSESAPEVYDDGKDEFAKILAQLESDQLPRMRLPGALV